MQTRPVYLEAELGDPRRTKRFNEILSSLDGNYSKSIPAAMESKSSIKAANRFFKNEHISFENLLLSHTAKIDFQYKDYLLYLSDTVVLDYTNKRGAKNLGYLTKPYLRGMYLHNDMIISDLGIVLGIPKQQYHNRSIEYFGKSAERQNLPIEQKESNRWLESFKTAKTLSQTKDLPLVWTADREADIIEILAAPRPTKLELLIRAQHNRSLVEHKSRLFSLLKQQPTLDTYEIEIIHPKTLKKRTAQLAIRSCSSVQLNITATTKHKQKLQRPYINAVEVYEINPPEDIDQPIRWVLLTTLPVDSFEQAKLVVDFYVLRWLIERFHYLLKSGGANVEDLQYEKPDTLKKVITTKSIVVMRAMKIRYIAQNQPDTNIFEAGISVKEYEVLYTYAQHKINSKLVVDFNQPPTIFEYCRILGQIGGFIPKKRQPLPGLKILTRSLEKLDNMIQFYDVLMSKNF